MRNASPAHIGDVEKTIESIQVDERAVIGNVLDHTASGIARFDASENLALFAHGGVPQ